MWRMMQDVRGRYRSEGEWYPFAKEAPDGYDTVEWAAAQPWCDGKVGTIGGSYCGSDQSALATLYPPHLRAMVVAVGTSNYHTSSMRQNGALELRFMVYTFLMATTSREALADPTLKAALEADYAHIGEWLTRTPYKKGSSALRFLPSYEQWLLDILSHGDFDDYWRQRGYAIDQYYEQHADVPTIYLGGWYDSYARGTTSNYVALSKMKKSPQRLLMGPWTHGGWGVSYAGDVDFGADSVLDDYDGYRLRWFDRWLKGIDNGVDRRTRRCASLSWAGEIAARMRAGGCAHLGAWRDAADWPLPGTRYVPYYLHADGAPEPHSARALRALTLHLRPARPGAHHRRRALGGGAWCCRPGATTSGATRASTAAATRCPCRRAAMCSSSRPPSWPKTWRSPARSPSGCGPPPRPWTRTFTAKLIDVHPPNADYPDGFAQNLSDSILRARYRGSRERPELLEPGRVYAFEIVMYPTSNCFAAGHRIRLDVSSSNFPRFDVNPNTGGPLGTDRRMRRGRERRLSRSGSPVAHRVARHPQVNE